MIDQRLHRELRQSLGRAAATVDAEAGLARLLERSSLDSTDAASPSRRPGRPVVALAGVALLVLIAWGLVSLPGSHGRTGLAGGGGSRRLGPDSFDEAIAAIAGRGPVLLPRTVPPDLEWVSLVRINGLEHLRVQHSDVTVSVCGSPCGPSTNVTIRVLDTSAGPYRVVYSGNSQIDTTPPPLPAELRQYWTTVEFSSERPAWLTPDLEAASLAGVPRVEREARARTTQAGKAP